MTAPCDRCGNIAELVTRRLCPSCRGQCRRAGTVEDWGYLKPDRLADFTVLRARGYRPAVAAVRLGLSARTGYRYEAELRGAAA